ncbi:MAG: hypothetical protein EBR82_45995 [Caulobacteraceae bacterium]|nr:hypothetical protein [Caulobacteraceae bacterium]
MIDVALGVDGHATKRGSAMTDELQKLQDRLRQFPLPICRKYSLRAVNAAGKIGKAALKSQVGQLGKKTGNLARAVAMRTRFYTRNRWGLPVGVAIVGYRRSGTGSSRKVQGGTIQKGNDRAFHSHLVEFGTKRRFPGKSRKIKSGRVNINGFRQTLVQRAKEAVAGNSVLMSSYTSSGPFRTSRSGTTPPYPKAFIARINPAVGLGEMPAFHPLEKAFNASRSAMQSVLLQSMKDGIQRAQIDLKRGGG